MTSFPWKAAALAGLDLSGLTPGQIMGRRRPIGDGHVEALEFPAPRLIEKGVVSIGEGRLDLSPLLVL